MLSHERKLIELQDLAAKRDGLLSIFFSNKDRWTCSVSAVANRASMIFCAGSGVTMALAIEACYQDWQAQ